MPYAIENNAFFKDKTTFFSKISDSSSFDDAKPMISEKDYSFLVENKSMIEAEFSHLFSVLKDKSEDKKEFWIYCYYCASLLEQFYLAYGQKGRAKDFTKHKENILKRLNNEKEVKPANEEAYIQKLLAGFKESLTNLVTAPAHVSKIRDYVAFTNISRLYWVFCRLTMTQGLMLAASLEWLDKLQVDNIISVFNAPSGVISYFSVGLFLARFMLDAGILIKHTFFPRDIESESTWFQRFKFELNKRYGRFANDLVWATVNFLTNLNHISGIPGPITGYITAAFLIFDVSLILIQCSMAYSDYKLKKEQYETEFLTATPRQQEILEEQIIQLTIEWETKKATFYFCAAAATLLMVGFSASLIANPLIITSLCFFACTVAVAMYLSAGAYSQYQEKSLYLEEAQMSDKNIALAQKEYEIARNEFMFTMLKNTFIPMLLITTFAVCWPAAIVLTALYIGSELFHGYMQHEKTNESSQLALAM